MLKSAAALVLILSSLVFALEQSDQVKINELYFAGSEQGEHSDGFIELFNAGDEVAYLDGALLAQGVDTFSQIAFSFPGVPGETNYPLLPGEFLVIAIDAHDFTDTDPSSVNLADSDWETVVLFEEAPGDNPDVNNLDVSLEVGFDWFFVRDWGMVTLSTGVGWYILPCEPGEACGNLIAYIPQNDIVDGLEYLYQLGDTLPILPDYIDEGAVLGIPWNSGMSAERVTPGQDTNNSLVDFHALASPTPGYSGSLDAREPAPELIPRTSSITSVYPNPFNWSTSIEFELASAATPRLQIFDVLGREVATISNGNMSAGVHNVRWNGLDSNGSAAPSGLYFVRLSDRNMQSVARVILSR